MLLSASLGSLGSSLRNDRGELLVTKGVASVPAPVANLTDAFPDRKAMLEHQGFVQAVVAEFHRTYPGDESKGKTEVDEGWLDKPELNEGRWKLRENFEELQSWGWVFGQTPEFTHRVEMHDSSEVDASSTGEGGWGTFAVEVHSKEGIVLDAKLVDARFDNAEVERRVRAVVQDLKGRRYDELALPPPWGPASSTATSVAGIDKATSIEDKLLHWLRTVL
uniref:Lipoate--protein ligase n=2 Tax=Kalmanozyma brasiliensis (strain GHG001) TaxID=1365824 RepID=V5EUP8_KALBG